MTTGVDSCDRCGQVSMHLFPDPRSASRICSRCFEGLRLHQQGVLMSKMGIIAILPGGGLLLGVVILLLFYSSTG